MGVRWRWGRGALGESDNRRKSEERVIWYIRPAVNLVHEAAGSLVAT